MKEEEEKYSKNDIRILTKNSLKRFLLARMDTTLIMV